MDMLRCVRCYRKLELHSIINNKDECIEGILYCNCGISYPIVDGIAILINDLIEYFASRRSILGYLLVNSSNRMREYLKFIAQSLPKKVYIMIDMSIMH